jgi:hypothetical protein
VAVFENLFERGERGEGEGKQRDGR